MEVDLYLHWENELDRSLRFFARKPRVNCMLEHHRIRYIGRRLRCFGNVLRVDWLEQKQSL